MRSGHPRAHRRALLVGRLLTGALVLLLLNASMPYLATAGGGVIGGAAAEPLGFAHLS